MVMSADELEALAAKLKAARDADKRAGELPGVGAERLANGHLAKAASRGRHALLSQGDTDLL